MKFEKMSQDGNNLFQRFFKDSQNKILIEFE